MASKPLPIVIVIVIVIAIAIAIANVIAFVMSTIADIPDVFCAACLCSEGCTCICMQGGSWVAVSPPTVPRPHHSISATLMSYTPTSSLHRALVKAALLLH